MAVRPPPCEWQLIAPHALTYARLYPSGWWCARHIPTWQRARPSPEPGSPARAHRQPSPGTDTEAADPNGTQHEQDPT